MLDQSFSARNFEIIYGIESRKGTIDLESMPPYYQDAVKSIKEARRSECELRARMKSTSSCPEEKERTRLELAEIKESLSELKRTKSRLLQKYLEELSQEVNARGFRFQLKCLDSKAAKAVFTLGAKSHAAFFAMKQLQHNLRNTFKVCPANRRHILANVKIFLNSKIPVYIIRTDIDSFFESIPQDKLKDLVLQESLLSPKSRSFVKGVLNEYERIKSKDASLASLPKGCGVPRGVGISSYLSEIYLRGLDRELSSRREVLYYARYVDDIFIILSGLDSYRTLGDYYKGINDSCDRKFRLKLKQPATSSKCQLIDLFSKDNVSEEVFDYLGYQLRVQRQSKYGVTCSFWMAQGKIDRFKDRIKNAIGHFESLSKSNARQAYRDLLDSMDYLTGNISLSGVKSGVKVGLYYSNDLLSEDGVNSLVGLTEFLHSQKVTPYNRLVGGWILKARIERMFRQIDFVKCWEEKRFNNFSSERIREIESWL